VEARRPGGGVFHPLLSANLTFDLPPAYALEIVEPTGDILAPGARVAGRLVDALDGAPFVGIGVILEAEGIPIRLNVTDADGRVTFDLPEGVAERLVLGLAVEGARDAPGARVERILRTQPPAPLDTSAIPAASLEPERGTPGEPLAALLVVALVSALAARRRGAA
jgi:hypothetical protein